MWISVVFLLAERCYSFAFAAQSWDDLSIEASWGDPLFFLTVSAGKESSSFAKLRLRPLPLFLKITLFNRFN
jgi:hypothetical protein